MHQALKGIKGADRDTVFREFAAIHALSTGVALNMNLQIRFFSEFLGDVPP